MFGAVAGAFEGDDVWRGGRCGGRSSPRQRHDHQRRSPSGCLAVWGRHVWSGSWPPGLTCGFRCRTRPSDRNQSCGQPPGQMPTACSRHLEEETARTMKSRRCTPPRRSLSLRKTIHDRGKTPLCAHDFSQSHEDLHALVRSIRSLIRKKCAFQWKQPCIHPIRPKRPDGEQAIRKLVDDRGGGNPPYTTFIKFRSAQLSEHFIVRRSLVSHLVIPHPVPFHNAAGLLRGT